MNEIFAKLYVDECISPQVTFLLKNKGWDAVSADQTTFGFSDIDQLSVAISQKRVFLTCDINTFLKEIVGMSHHGIILVSRTISLNDISALVKKIEVYLNRYTIDEFVGAVFWINL